MNASHDMIVVSCIVHANSVHFDNERGGTCERNVTLKAGSTLQNLLDEIDDGSYDLFDITVNGRSVSRLTPLLVGDTIDIELPAVIDLP